MNGERLLKTKPCGCGGGCAKCRGEERTLRRKATGPAPAAHAPSVVHDVLNSPGRSLDTSTRGFFEGRFGYDFGRVRVHADSRAAESAKAVNASAYTVGQHIVFDEGRYDPASGPGRELMAHELAHTIQQDHAAGAAGPISIGAPDDRSEREADGAAAAVVNQQSAAIDSRDTRRIRRQPNPAPAPPQHDLGADLSESASPFLAASIGSVTIDGFVTGKSEISPVNLERLQRTARVIQKLLKKYPSATVRVIGHTDAVGKESDNQTLGQARADAVRDALAGTGIPAEMLQAESKGESQLLVKTEKAEARNRRVEVRFNPNAAGPAGTPPAPTLALPDAPAKGAVDQPAPQPNLRLPPDYDPDKPRPPFKPKDPLPPWFWKDLPAGPKIPGQSIDDKINDVAGKITSFLPKSIREKAQGLVKDAIEKGITAGLDSGLQSAGVDEKGRQAIGKAVEAALKQKIGGSQ